MDKTRQVRGDARADRPRAGPVDWLADLARTRKPGPSMRDHSFRKTGVSTRAVHAGSGADALTGAVGTPIYQNTTFLLGEREYEAFEEGHARDGFIYTRYGNPSQWAVQDKLAALEGAESALVCSSGMAAISSALLALLDKGGHVVASRDLYGGNYAFLNGELPNLGMSATLVDPADMKAVEAAIRPETQILFFEAMSNPLLRIADISALAGVARRHGLRLVVDATFMTPAVCRPLEHGADIVVHSATKYLNGHSDLVAGAAVGPRKLVDRIWERMLSFGGCLDPHGCFLLERGLKTLGVRMRAHAEGAEALARFLEASPRVRRVYYPLFESHPDHAVARRLMRQGTGMITFEIGGGDRAALQLLDALTIPFQATSLGGVESLVSLPFNSSHAGFTLGQRERMGIHPGCVRLSVGIEDVEDLIADFEQAFAKIYD